MTDREICNILNLQGYELREFRNLANQKWYEIQNETDIDLSDWTEEMIISSVLDRLYTCKERYGGMNKNLRTLIMADIAPNIYMETRRIALKGQFEL